MARAAAAADPQPQQPPPQQPPPQQQGPFRVMPPMQRMVPAFVRDSALLVENLKVGQHAPVLDKMRYPPDYKQDQVDEDRRQLSVALQFLTNRLGKLESYELRPETPECYWIGLGMGSSEYWDKLPKPEPSELVTFEAKYSKSPDPVILRFTEASSEGKGWLRSLEFGIPTKAPNARAKMSKMAQQMYERMKAMTIPPSAKPKLEPDPKADPKAAKRAEQP